MASSKDKAFVAYVVELMQVIGPVQSRAMFGGHGLFLDGLMFALVSNTVLYLKVDKGSLANFQSRGLDAFTYVKNSKDYKMSYYQAPDEALEDVAEMSHWANQAYASARRAAAIKVKK
jgi:DNA transformation protein